MSISDTHPALVLEIRSDTIAVLTFDTPDKPVNTFNEGTFSEFEARMDELESRGNLRGLILSSGKKGNFIAGADLNEIVAPDSRDFIERGHRLFTRISRLPFPTVAAIDGTCVGGGLECALAFDYRLASDHPRTELGLPEVKIGIIPGWGGTQRLPRLVGIDKALEMICSGNSIKPAEAVDVGLVWAVVPDAMLMDEAVRLVNMAHELDDWKRERQRREEGMALNEDHLSFNFAVARSQVLAETKGHYPAPMSAIEAIEKGCNLPLQEAFQQEMERAVPLNGSEINRNLVALFFMDARARKDPGVSGPSIQPRSLTRTGILGGGQMGAGIAFAHARKGLNATLADLDDDLLAEGLARVRRPMDRRIKAGRMKAQEAMEALTRIRTTTDRATMGDCDLVVEAVVENREVKIPILQEMERVTASETILASNTSTISITSMAQHLERPGQFVGMHFFNPVDRMQLVEVIRGQQTSDETVATAVAHAKRLGKKPVVVNDCPGFVVNRCLLPYMNEAYLMLEEGTDMQQIDRAVTRFGLPMGPIALTDLVGLDVTLSCCEVLKDAYPERATLPRILSKLVEQGRLGQKSGAGFYAYDPAKKRKGGVADGVAEQLVKEIGREPAPADDEAAQERPLLTMLAEAVRLLAEGIARTAEDVDFGLINGIGFPPFRGGVLRWCDSLGAAAVQAKLARYEPLGKRFECPAMLAEMARSGGRFFPN